MIKTKTKNETRIRIEKGVVKVDRHAIGISLMREIKVRRQTRQTTPSRES